VLSPVLPPLEESTEGGGSADCFVFESLRLDLGTFGMVVWVEELFGQNEVWSVF
jgi:hypothetical protein